MCALGQPPREGTQEKLSTAKAEQGEAGELAPPALSETRRKSGSDGDRSVTCQQLLQTPGTGLGNPQSSPDTVT